MADCYAVLGLLHAQWRPVPGRIKDFIAMPRPNLYQSLHTTLIAPGGHQFEVQIRTEEMHRIAEEGIAAHWKYKAGDNVSAKDEQRLAWVRQLMEWQREMSDPNEFMSTLKIDLYPEEVYTFTPKGKVVVLPKDASPIDFAYAIHTEVGNTTIGAKVNGRIVPLRTTLRNGDIVEITTQTGHAPIRDWLSFTKIQPRPQQDQALAQRAPARARHRDRQEAARPRSPQVQGLARQVQRGRLRPRRQRIRPRHRAPSCSPASASASTPPASGAQQARARLHHGRRRPRSPNPASSATRIAQMSDAVKRVFFGKGSDSLQVEGQDDLLVYRARCCNPIRGEEIIGYVTRGKGVAVHARGCPNVQNLLYESDRRIQVEWAADAAPAPAPHKPTTYPVKLTVLCDDRAGMLKEFTAIISDDGTNIRSVDSKPTTDGSVVVDFVIETVDVRHLNQAHRRTSARSPASATSSASRRSERAGPPTLEPLPAYRPR